MISVIFPYREVPERKVVFEFVVKIYGATFPEAEFIIADDPWGRFNRGRAINAGVSKSTGDLLVFADADLLVMPFALFSAVEMVKEEQFSYFIPFSRIAYLNEQATEKVLKGQVMNESYPGTQFFKHPSTGGINILSRKNFDIACGFDERFSGWGYEDAAFDAAIQTLTEKKPHWIQGPAYHFEHPPSRDPTNPDHAFGGALCDRYRLAINNIDQMKEIIKERDAS